MADFNKVGHRFPDGLRQIGGRFSSSGKLLVRFGHDDILLAERQETKEHQNLKNS